MRTWQDPELIREGESAAGFVDVDVDVQRSRHGIDVDDWAAFWNETVDSTAPLALMRQPWGATAWAEQSPQAVAHLEAHGPALPGRPHRDAWLAVAQKPA